MWVMSLYCVARAVARFLWGGEAGGNINLSIKTFLQNFKIDENCIANFYNFQMFCKLIINISIILKFVSF